MKVTEFNVGQWCLSEDECIASGINFAAYERGVSDAAKAFGQNREPTLPLMTDEDWQAIADEADRIVPGRLIAVIQKHINLAVARGVSPCPALSREHRELMLLAAADLESWMKSYNRDAATEDLVKRLRDAAGVEGTHR